MSLTCNICSCTFKTNQHYQRHLSSNKHQLRINNNVKLFECVGCEKKFSHSSTLYNHKSKCKLLSQVVLQKQMKDIKEEERQNEFEAMKKELLKTNKRLQKLETKTTTTSPLVPTIRRKINKDLRQSIVDKQENACGSCKLALTSYFQIDHTVGLQFGGTNEESNLMALCCECHAMKSIAENKCRKQIREAIQTILIGNLEK